MTMRPRSMFTAWTIAMAAIAVVALGLLLLSVAHTLDAAGRANSMRAVDRDLVSLADIYESGGRGELVRRLDDRVSFDRNPDTGTFYRLADGSGSMLAGNLPEAARIDPAQSGFSSLALPGGQDGFARATLLDRDLVLTVAHGSAEWDTAMHSVLLALVSTGLAIAVVAVAVGALATWRLRRRIEKINAALAAIERGSLDERLPADNRGDEIARLSRHANTMIEQLVRAVRAHREVSDHTAHEIRTPLTHLSLRLHAIMDSGDIAPDHSAADALMRARQDIAELTAILDSLLDISHSEAHRGETAQFPEVDFSALVAEMAELYDDSDGSLRLSIEPGVVIAGDRMQLARMVANLLDNAFKYGAQPNPVVEVSLCAGPVLRIADDGPGVPPEQRERIFERFARGAGHEARGHGLGLSLARAIAERHGLRVTVQDNMDRKGTGAVFQIDPMEGRQ